VFIFSCFGIILTFLFTVKVGMGEKVCGVSPANKQQAGNQTISWAEYLQKCNVVEENEVAEKHRFAFYRKCNNKSLKRLPRTIPTSGKTFGQEINIPCME
jgi:hypothetical protein